MKKHLFLMLVLLLTAGISAAETKTDTDEGLMNLDFSSEQTIIEAEKLLLFAKKREFEYTGAVDVEHGDLKLTCRKLRGSYTEENEIDSLIATDDVFIEKGPTIKASGNKAVFNSAAQTLTLTENPQLQQEGSLLSADEVVIYLKEDRSEAVGNVRVTILQKQEEGQPAKPKTNSTQAILGQ